MDNVYYYVLAHFFYHSRPGGMKGMALFGIGPSASTSFTEMQVPNPRPRVFRWYDTQTCTIRSRRNRFEILQYVKKKNLMSSRFPGSLASPPSLPRLSYPPTLVKFQTTPVRLHIFRRNNSAELAGQLQIPRSATAPP